MTSSPIHRQPSDAVALGRPSLDGLRPLDAAMVRGVESCYRLVEHLIEEVDRALERIKAAPHDGGAQAHAAMLVADLEQLALMAGSMFATLERRAAEQARLQACVASRAELAWHDRTEARVWAQSATVRADLATALRSGATLGSALAIALPRVDRIARRPLLASRRRIERAIHVAARRAPRAHARSRAPRRRRCASSRARPANASDGEPPPRRPIPRARGPPPVHWIATPETPSIPEYHLRVPGVGRAPHRQQVEPGRAGATSKRYTRTLTPRRGPGQPLFSFFRKGPRAHARNTNVRLSTTRAPPRVARDHPALTTGRHHHAPGVAQRLRAFPFSPRSYFLSPSVSRSASLKSHVESGSPQCSAAAARVSFCSAVMRIGTMNSLRVALRVALRRLMRAVMRLMIPPGATFVGTRVAGRLPCRTTTPGTVHSAQSAQDHQFPRDGHPPVIASASRSSVLPVARYQRDLPSPIVVAS